MAPADVHLPRRAPLLPISIFFLLSVSLPRLAVGDQGTPAVPKGMMDGRALLMFKDALGNPAVLSSWVQDADPCDEKGRPWIGVLCFNGVVTGVRLGSMGLSATLDDKGIEPLSRLPSLRTISLANNNLSGDISGFSGLVALKSLFLSNNHFSGTLSNGFFSNLSHLKKIWLSGNAFTGSIPSSVSKLPHLLELHLEDNQFTGGIPAISTPNLKSFDVSNNKLEGEIPAALLSRFDASAFKGNPGLCDPKAAGPSCKPAPASAAADSPEEVKSGRTMMVGIVLGMVILALVAVLIVLKKRREEPFDMLGVEQAAVETVSVDMPPAGGSTKRGAGSGHKRHDSSSSKKGSVSGKGGSVGGGDGPGDLVMVNSEKGAFALADLMKAAAEVLGNGGMGSAYKAVMANGMAVVVKRMRDLNRMGKDGFEAEIRRLGRLRHPNVLTPLAYHYRKEEKLIVVEYVEKGSLLYALHGDRGAHHAALDWPTRLKIVRGIAQGMAYLHTELASSDVPHGNLKSGNVLLGPNYEPLLSDYGFTSLVNPSQASVAMFAYKSPEAVQHHHVSTKSDIYSLGVIILEVVTGKFPSQYLNNGKGGTDVVEWALSAVTGRWEAELIDPEIAVEAKQSLGAIEQLLQIGAICVDPRPENRPNMKEVAQRVNEIMVKGPRKDDDGFNTITLLKDESTEFMTKKLSQENVVDHFEIS